ncbi:C40 family peptidase [Bacillus sp. EB106-08-02-XG196]|jgi:peptidoglycan DL-endopeptidase CwlO|uniref:C40 family peptidase n=1 Tax=Bacillus sp. EB106-08-02-XG196 TaxID=2737049 RepID=UPI0015C42950|nr:C40 family peptidase [Bacillus sp. EB106-08-02-XG196]NWQ44365.1 C40 family peptidase [Bacillus sp. EB106-08-02-XG196]
MIKKFIKYMVATTVLATTIQATPAFANPEVPVTNGQIDAVNKNIDDLETKFQQLDNEISLSMERSQILNEKIGTQQGKIEETEIEIKKADEDLLNHKEVYSERLKSIQVKGNQSVVTYAELLLSAGSVSEFFNRFTAISKIIENDNELLEGLRVKEVTLKEAKEQLQNHINQLEKSKVELAKEQKQIEENKIKISQDLEAAKGELENLRAQQVAQLAAQQAALQEPAQETQPQSQAQVSVNTQSTAPSVAASNVTNSATANSVIANAKQYLGVPYVWGGSTPSGFDCSGFTSYVFRSVGISLPRTSRAQQNVGTRISLNQVQPGDLVFRGSPAYHVGIYIGGGQYIHAPQTGDVVKIAPFNPSKFSSASRVLH